MKYITWQSMAFALICTLLICVMGSSLPGVMVLVDCNVNTPRQ